MSDPIFIFNTTGTLGYITSQFIQGAVLHGVSVHTNVESQECDGRLYGANLRDLAVGYRHQPLLSEIVIVDENRFLSGFDDLGQAFLDYLLDIASSRKLALIYGNDDVNFLSFPSGLLKFLPHQCRGFTKNPEAVPVPWGFTLEGFNAAKLRQRNERDPRKILQNFNPTGSQSVREAVVAALQLSDLGDLAVDERHLHGEEYAAQLAECQFSLAMGGTFYWPKSEFAWMRDNMGAKNLALDAFPERTKTVGVLRWDSFRFWESMAFGCLPIQLDLEKHGFLLPKMPEKWLHYIPLDLEGIQGTLEKINALTRSPEQLRFMSESAASWAYEHAHPAFLYQWVMEHIASH